MTQTRRTVLKTVAASGLLWGMGTASGQPPDSCPEGTALLAKFNIDDGEFVFEKGREDLEIDGSEFEFTVTKTKPSGEVLAFDWNSGPYDVYSVEAKFGPKTRSFDPDDIGYKTGEDETGSVDVSDQQQALSNVVFCAPAFWQVDIGVGDVPVPPAYEKDENPLAAFGSNPDAPNEFINNPSLSRDENDDFDFIEIAGDADSDDKFTIDSDRNTASVAVKNVGDTARKLHVASFAIPGKFRLDELEFQMLYDEEIITLDSDESYTFKVDLPKLP